MTSFLPTAAEEAGLRFLLPLGDLRFRLVLAGGFFAVGLAAWSLGPWPLAAVGLPLLLAGHLALWARSQTTAPGGATPAHEDVWAPVEDEWLERVSDLENALPTASLAGLANLFESFANENIWTGSGALTQKVFEGGAIKLDKEANDKRIITFHDSCNVARGSRMGDILGGQFEIPRNIIKASANHYFEMQSGTTHEKTFCCGGGGGLLTDDLIDLRVKGTLPRMEVLKKVVDDHGVNFLATICAICKAQFTKVLPIYGFDRGMVGGVHQLVNNAIRLGDK